MNAEEHACDALIRSMGGRVVTFAVPRRGAPAHVGLPDKRYYVRGHAFFAEIKVGPKDYDQIGRKAVQDKGDHLTEAQANFLLAEYDHGQIIFAGDAAALANMVTQLPSAWRQCGYVQFKKILARGWRRGRKAA